jgi:two-component SAPR family response regulator
MIEKYAKIFIAHLLFIVLLYSVQILTAQTYGLKFQGQDVTLDKRTELNLTPDNYLKFKDEFEVSFDIKMDLLERNSLFGYVLRVISEDNYNVDLISTPEPTQPLNLIIGKSNTIVSVKRFENAINQWINLRLKFILSEDKAILYITDTFYVQNDIGLNKEDAFKIIFGANDHKQFKTTDVPSMNIRNVKLIENGHLKYHWPLEVREGNIAIDRIKKIPASVKNPIWLILDHESWQKKYETEVHGTLLFAVDEEKERIFMVGNNELIIYSAENNNVEKVQYKNKPNFIANNYNAFYNSTDNKIYCYLVEKTPVYTLDIEAGEWSETGSSSDVETRYKHHNQYYSVSDSSLYLFGGYGFHKYNNEIFKLDLNENSWTVLNTNDSIFRPRYLAGLGTLNDTAYILGGYGSESGNQLINPQSYYDLVGYSLNDGKLFKKFEVSRIIDDMAVANSMWIDKQTRDYYALIFEKTKFDGYLQLVEGNLGSSDIKMLGNRIPFRFLDIKSSAGLYYMPRQKKLFAYTAYNSDSVTTQAQIYSISYPPNVFEAEDDLTETRYLAYWIIGILSLLIFSIVIWTSRKRKSKHDNVVIDTPEIDPDHHQTDNSPIPTVEEIKYRLIFFGGFQVFNKDFEDITNKFSPLLKELFLLIWLYTYKNNKGISSDKITEILWFDKSEKSSRNNRAVNIAKLRGIMEEDGICTLSKKTGYWKINCEDSGLKCDYVDFLNLTSSKTNLTKQKVQQLINITGKGAFLHNVSYEWLDEFKSRTSDTIIDTFVEFGKACDIKKEPEFIIDLTDAIFHFDFVNEDAMMMKCKAEYCMGKHSLAKSTYEKFCKEYLTMYGQEYEKSFRKILNI